MSHTSEEAVALVEARRAELRISRAMGVASSERAIVAYRPRPDRPEPAQDRIAWIVTFSSPLGAVRVDVDDRTGEILNVHRSA